MTWTGLAQYMIASFWTAVLLSIVFDSYYRSKRK